MQVFEKVQLHASCLFFGILLGLNRYLRFEAQRKIFMNNKITDRATIGFKEGYGRRSGDLLYAACSDF